CGAARLAVAVSGGRIANGTSSHFSGASAGAPALRIHTSTMPCGLTASRVHMSYAAALHSCSTVHPVALNTLHLNCRGAVPLLAARHSCSTGHPVALNACRLAGTGAVGAGAGDVSGIVVPGGCGAATAAVTVSAVTAGIGTAGIRIGYGKSIHVSGASAQCS